MNSVLRSTYEALYQFKLLLGSIATRPLYTTNNLLDIARMKIPTSRAVQSEGYIKGISSGMQDVSELGVMTTPAPSLAGETMQIVSTSANDSISGSGSRTVAIEYIEPITELYKNIEVELNGTTAVTIPVPIAFVNDFYVKQSASLDTVANGDITIYNGTTVYNIIKAGNNKALSLFRYIPKDRNFYITSIVVSGNSKELTVRLRANIADDGTKLDSYIFKSIAISTEGTASIPFEPPIIIPASTYVKGTIYSDAVDNSGMVSVTLNGWVEKN